MLEWSSTSPHRTLQLLIRQREYAYDVDPVLGSSTEKARAGTVERGWVAVDMAADWATIYPPDSKDS